MCGVCDLWVCVYFCLPLPSPPLLSVGCVGLCAATSKNLGYGIDRLRARYPDMRWVNGLYNDNFLAMLFHSVFCNVE